MKKENELALIVTYYISKFDKKAYQRLKLGGSTATHKAIGEILGVNPNTIRNMRDAFDSIHDNPRKGWHQRVLPPSRQGIVERFQKYLENEMFNTVQNILCPNSDLQTIFSEIDKKEI